MKTFVARWHKKTQALHLLTAWLVLLGAGAACNRDTCLGLYQPTPERNAPKLLSVDFVRQDSKNPWLMVMDIEFADRDGDVGDGNVLLYVGASSPLGLPLGPLFDASEVSREATSGRVALPLSLTQGAVQDDTTLRYGFQLQDALEHYSNCYTLDIHYDINNLSFGSSAPTATHVPCQQSPVVRQEEHHE